MRTPTWFATATVSMFVLVLGAPAAAGETIRVERVPPSGVTSPLGDWRAPSEPPWGLALGGGGAWGLAHLGFLEGMEQDGLRPPRLAGTSAGALAGAAYASGIPTAEIVETFRAAERDPRRSLIDASGGSTHAVPRDPLAPAHAPIRFGPGRDGRPLPWRGLFPEDKLSGVLAQFFARPGVDAGGDLDRLPVPFRAVAADLETNATFAPRHGSLPLLVRASIAVPVFAPVRVGDRVLVDGGVFEEVPVPTLRAIGAAPVIGVRLTADGEDFEGLPEKFGFARLNDLYTNRIIDAHRREVVEAADLRVDLRVGDVSQAGFLGQLDRLLAAGRASWDEHRDRVLAVIGGSGSRPIRLARVVAADPDHAAAAGRVGSRLGLDDGAIEVARLRIELELVRSLRRGLGEDARLEVGDDGTAVLHVVPLAPVRDGRLEVPDGLVAWMDGVDPADWPGRSPREVVSEVEDRILAARRDGRFLAGLARVDWDPGTGALTVEVDDGTVDAIRLRTLGSSLDAADRPVPGVLAAMRGRPADLDRLRTALDDLERRDLLHGARIVEVGRAGAGGGMEVVLEAEATPRRRTTLAFGIGDAFVPTVLWGFHVPRLRGSDWVLDARVAGGREGVVAGAELARNRERGPEPFARVAGGRPVLPRYDEAGGTDGRLWMSSAGVAAGVRLRDTRAGAVEVGIAGRWASDPALVEVDRDEAGFDLGVQAAWAGQIGDDPVEPLRALEWRLEAAVPVAGRRRAAAGALDFGGRSRVGQRRRWGLEFLARAAWTEAGRPLPLDRWPEAGAWLEAPGLAPGRSRSREVLRGTALVRRSLGMLGPLPIHAGVSIGSWRIDDVRVDPALPRSGSGAALFAQAALPRAGALTIGWSHADFDGDRFFVLLDPTRVPWPGIRVRLPGRN